MVVVLNDLELDIGEVYLLYPQRNVFVALDFTDKLDDIDHANLLLELEISFPDRLYSSW